MNNEPDPTYNRVIITNWNTRDHEVLYESLKGNRNRIKKSIHINEDLLSRFERLHPKRNNHTHSGVSLSDAVNKGLLLYIKLYEDEDEDKENREEGHHQARDIEY